MVDLIIIGGFLGAGKTTLLWTLARSFSQKGKKVGLITNDQASELVDTLLLEISGSLVKEVSGSCFCCNFNGFAAAIEQFVKEDQVDLILAEPVGSCTDLTATILPPLKEKYAELVKVHPLNVLADADKIQQLIHGKELGLHKSTMYIYKKQLEEADYIIINKTETLDEGEKEALRADVSAYFSKKNVFLISALMETGVDEWLSCMLSDQQAGVHMTEVDYDIYAEGEAVLGWLNAAVLLEGEKTNWGVYLKKLMSSLEAAFNQEKVAVGHIKAIVTSDGGLQIAYITGSKAPLRVKGESVISEKAVMKINARVECKPQRLQEIIEKTVKEECPDDASFTITAINCLQPGRPEPTYRYKITM